MNDEQTWATALSELLVISHGSRLVVDSLLTQMGGLVEVKVVT